MGKVSTKAELLRPAGFSADGPGAGVTPELTALYERHWTELCAHVRRTFGFGPPEPEDVAQAAFVSFASYPQRAEVENPRAFLYATARNIVLNHLRHEKYCRDHARDVLHGADLEILSDISPERVLLDKERVRLFAAALAKLPTKIRRMVLLNRLEGLSYADIAARFGATESSVQKQISRALAACRIDMAATRRAAPGPNNEDKP